MRFLTLFPAALLLAALAACSSDSPAPPPGSPAGDAGAETAGDAARTDGGPDGATCPIDPPSGNCSDPSIECHYVDAQGCPQAYECFDDHIGAPAWSIRIPDPGGTCSMPGQSCKYSETVGDNLPSYGALKCGASGKWEQESVCPPAIPTPGESCGYPFLSCSYMACGGTRLAYCNGPADGWQLEPCPDAGP
jgi:hypothetical protein